MNHEVCSQSVHTEVQVRSPSVHVGYVADKVMTADFLRVLILFAVSVVRGGCSWGEGSGCSRPRNRAKFAAKRAEMYFK